MGLQIYLFLIQSYPYKQANVESDKHFLAFEKSYIVNEDETTSQDWIVQDFSDLIGLDSGSVSTLGLTLMETMTWMLY